MSVAEFHGGKNLSNIKKKKNWETSPFMYIAKVYAANNLSNIYLFIFIITLKEKNNASLVIF